MLRRPKYQQSAEVLAEYLSIVADKIEEHKRQLASARKWGNLVSVTKECVEVGDLFRSAHQFPTALEYYEQALSLVRQVGDLQREADILFEIGRAHFDMDELPLALNDFRRAMIICDRVGRDRQGSIIRMCIADIYFEQGSSSKSLGYYTQALEIAEKVGDTWLERRLHLTIATLSAQLGDDAAVETHYRLALSSGKTIPLIGPAIAFSLAELYRRQGRLSEAVSLLEYACNPRLKSCFPSWNGPSPQSVLSEVLAEIAAQES